MASDPRRSPKAVAEDWKPKRCQAEGCEKKHPSFSAGGKEGPWLCREHWHQLISSNAPAPPAKPETPSPSASKASPAQSSSPSSSQGKLLRSEERRVGKECVSPLRSR